MPKKEPWTLQQLWESRHEVLADCQTNHERIMALALLRVEIKELAEKIKKTRKLTPGEQSILANLT